MHIAMLGQKGIPALYGGVERHVHELSLGLVKRGHEVTVYSRPWYVGKKAKKTLNGVMIKQLPSLHTKHLDTITHTFLATIDAIKNNVDVIHYHGVGPSLLAWIPRIFAPQIKVVATFHSIDRKHEKWGKIAQWFLGWGELAAGRFAHETIAVSRTIEQYARDVYDYEAEYIPNGVPHLTKIKATNKLKKWKIKPNQYILLVSRLIPHKGAHYATAAWQWLKKNQPGVLGNTKLVIVGDGYYTDKYVKQLKKSTGKDKSIVLTGFQNGETLAQLFSHAKLMVHPSDNEGLPIGVLEGMAYGLPILLSDIIEHRELVNSSVYNFAHGNPIDLAKKLAKLLTKNPAELTKQGLKNQRLARTDYNWKNITEQVIAVYEREVVPMTAAAKALAI